MNRASFFEKILLLSHTPDDVVHDVTRALANNTSLFITYMNAHVLCLTHTIKPLHDIVMQADIITGDGISVGLASLVLYGKISRRCIMTHAFDRFISHDAAPECRALLIGCTDDEVREAARKINERSKRIVIEQAYSGYETDEFYDEVLRKHRSVDLIFIGMSTPRSEFLCEKARVHCKNTIVWHIGAGTIMCHAGTKQRAPGWVQKAGIEWLHRFILEKHTRKRYLINNPYFLLLITGEFIRRTVGAVVSRVKSLFRNEQV